jgi:hypothetical protein
LLRTVVAFLRNYLHDKRSLLRTPHAMITEIKKITGAWSLYIGNGTISFLEALSPVSQMAFDEVHNIDTARRILS